MGLLTTAARIDVNMDKKAKCLCGDYAKLQYITEKGRIADQYVYVSNVPVYKCDCGESFMTGPDSIQFSEQVRVGINKGLHTINFNG